MNKFKPGAIPLSRKKLSLLLGGLLLSGAASAALHVTATRETDGTGACDATLDANQNNGLLCTNDNARYKVAYQVLPQGNEPPQNDVTLTLTIPAAEPFRFLPNSPGVQGCRNSNPISADGKTLTCQIRAQGSNPGAPIATQSGDLFFDVTTNNEAQNGSRLAAMTARITSVQNTAGETSSAPGLQVVAKPRADLRKRFLSGSALGRPAQCAGASSETEGYLLNFQVALQVPTRLGHEPLKEGWSYTEDMTAIAPNACLMDLRNYRVAAPQAALYGTAASGGNYKYTPGATGTAVITAFTAADVAANPNTSVPLTDGSVVANVSDQNFANSATAIHNLRIWVPRSEITSSSTGACFYSGENKLNNLDMPGRSGQPNEGEDLSNNTVPFGPVPLCSGSFSKQFTGNTQGVIATEGLNTPALLANQVVGPNDYFDSYVRFANSGASRQNASVCDRWDNRKVQLTLLDPAQHKSRYNTALRDGTTYYRFQTIRPGADPIQDSSPAYAHLSNADSTSQSPDGVEREIEFGFVGGGVYTDAVLRAATCNDGESTLAAVAQAGGAGAVPAAAITAIDGNGWIRQSQLKNHPELVPYINAVRLVNVNTGFGGGISLFTHLKSLDVNPFNGQPWPEGTILPNYGGFQMEGGLGGNSVVRAPGSGQWHQTTQARMGDDPHAVASCAASSTYCDDAYSDRLRLSKERIYVRKGIKDADPEGGPDRDNPVVAKRRGDIVTYQLWPTLIANTAGITINNDVTLVDTIPAGLRYVPGTLTFNGNLVPDADWHLQQNPDLSVYEESTLKVILRNIPATQPATDIPVVEFQAEVLLEDASNRAGVTRTNRVVVDACAPGAAINQSSGALTCASQTGDAQTEAARSANRTIQLSDAAALVVQKRVIGDTSKEIGSSFQIGLRYLNGSSSAVAEHRLIDILPANGETPRGNPDVDKDATNFSGERQLQKVTVPFAANYFVYYTTDAPGTINIDSKCPSNHAAPVGAWPAFAPGVPSASCAANTGVTNWTLATQSTADGKEWSGFPANTSAIQLVDKNPFAGTDGLREAVVEFSTPGSHDGDRYSNNFSGANGGPGDANAAGPGATYYVLSNNVTVRVFASSLMGTVFEDTNGNATTVGFEEGTDAPLPGVTMTLRKDGADVATAVTAVADIPAGQYYDRTTGQASATPNANTCPVPAGGLKQGQYLFCNLPAGSGYTVVEGATPGYFTVGNTAGDAGGAADNALDIIAGITLGEDQHAVNYDFGENKAAAVSGNVSVVDTNAPIVDVEVTLTYTYTEPGTGQARTVTVSTRTDASGNYTFPSVPVGATNLVIEQTQPDNYISESHSGGTNGGVADATNLNRITIPSLGAAGSQNNNFVERPATVVGGNVIARTNGADTPIPNVPVALTYTPPGGGSPVTVNTTTGPDGSYAFTGIPVGSTGLTIVETQPAGYANVGNAAGTSNAVDQGHGNGTSTITIATLDAAGSLNNNFIETNATDPVAGRVLDQNGNPITGVPITVTYTPPGGVPTTITVATDATGAYNVLLPRGSTGVTITETQPAGYLNSANEPGTGGAVDGGHTDTTSVITIGTLQPGGSTGNNFIERTSTNVSGRVYVAGSNAPIENVAVALTYTPPGGGAPVTLTTNTAADGSYQFNNLPVGATDVRIVETQPAAYANVGNEPGTDAADGGHTGTTSVITIATLAAGGSPNNNFVETNATAPVSGRVVDQNGDPIANVTITVSYTPPGATTPVTVELTTDAAGNYNTLLPRGATAVTITQTQPAGYVNSANEPGTGGAVDGGNTDTTSVITIATLPDAGSQNNNFVERAATSVSGRVYVAGSNDPIADVPVALTYLPPGANPGDEVTVTTTTAADGSYQFNNLPVGATDVRIVETQPATYANVGNEPGTDAADGGHTGTTSVITIATLAAGGSPNNNFVETNATSPVGGRVVDQSGNPIANVTVTVSYTPPGATTPVTVELTTDAAGNYNTLLPRGATAVTITQTQPAGYVNLANEPGADAVNAGNNPGTTTPSVITIATLPAGGSTNNNFVENEAAAVNGRVYVAGSNTPIPGVAVELTYMPPWGTSPADAITVSTTTNADGNYEFTGVPVGATDLSIVETQPTGYANVVNLPGTDATDEGNTVGATGGRSAFRIARLRPGGSVGNNFVESQGVAPVSGAVRTSTGDPIADVQIAVTYTPPGMSTPTTVIALTDAAGNYRTELPPGATNVTITETQPAGYANAGNEPGTGGAADGGNTATTSVITIGTLPAAGSVNNNFIERASNARVAGRVLVQGSNTPLQGVPVALTYIPPGGGAPVTVSTTTDADGNYEFANLPVGATNLVIEETQPAGYSNAGNAPGGNATDGGHTASASRILIAELPATGSVGNNFMEVQGVAPVSGRVYDSTGNRGIADVAITITYTPPGGGTPVTVSLNTNGNGEYSANLPPGATAITITEAQPSGYANVRNEPGTGASNASGNDTGGASNSVLAIATLPAGGSAGNNFVETRATGTGEVKPVPSLQAMSVLMLSLMMMGAYLGTRRRQRP